ncbi:group II intron maturase-specific domain-containing protein [Thiocapsa bogorovii]|uniref:group II intron maturase-specific domain-containing protein n=1 Tax=Thiocapsa bogorovii TaxID=521689 RepID=UPI0038CD98FA
MFHGPRGSSMAEKRRGREQWRELVGGWPCSGLTSRRWLLLDPQERVGRLNRTLIGWANYFSLGPVSSAYRAVDQHARGRLRWWLRKKHKQPGQGTARFPDAHLYDVLGLQRLSVRTRNLRWANA